MTAPARPGRRAWLLPAALALVQCLLLLHTAWDKSDTADEPVYIAAAGLLWGHRDFAYNGAAPVLPKWGFALAMRPVAPWMAHMPTEWHRPVVHMLWNRTTERMRATLFAARAATVAVTVMGGLFLWAAGRRFGAGAAGLAHVFWCFSPTVLANGALATLDAWVTAMLCVVIWTAVRVFEHPSGRRFAAAGSALGLALACKVTALAVVPVLAVVAVGAVRRQRGAPGSFARRLALGLLALGGAAVLALWALYGFRLGSVSTNPLAAAGGDGARMGPLPFPAWIEGLLHQSQLGAAGHRGYLFGQVGTEGWWWFYLAALALKTTVGAQLLAGARVVAWLRRLPPRRELCVDAVLLAFPLLLLVVMSMGRTQTGIRYLLPAFPFMFLWLGRAAPDLRRAFGGTGTAAALVLAGLGAGESLAVHPHHLMFFNLWAGGPTGGPRYLVHGDDWGQDQRRLGEWIARHSPDGVFYTYYAGMPEKWGVRYKPPPCTPRRGVYALHAVEVHRPRRMEPGCLDWLTVEPPDERIAYSIYIYYVNKERLDRLVAARNTPTPFARSGSPPP
jgi:hypothetical protein